MPTAHELRQRLGRVDALRDVVHLMRSLAVTHLRRAETRLSGVRLYVRTVSRALRAVAVEVPAQARADLAPAGPDAVVVITSQQGMCGRYNEVLIERLRAHLDHLGGDARAIVIGDRGLSLARMHGLRIAYHAPGPTSPSGIDRSVRRVAHEIQLVHERQQLGRLWLLHAIHQSVGRFRDRLYQLLPLQLEHFAEDDGPVAQPPRRYLPAEELLTKLVGEFYFIALCRGLTEALAAENSMRLHAMEAARTSIDETRAELEQLWRSVRQEEITSELLEVLAGAEALRQREADDA